MESLKIPSTEPSGHIYANMAIHPHQLFSSSDLNITAPGFSSTSQQSRRLMLYHLYNLVIYILTVLAAVFAPTGLNETMPSKLNKKRKSKRAPLVNDSQAGESEATILIANANSAVLEPLSPNSGTVQESAQESKLLLLAAGNKGRLIEGQLANIVKTNYIVVEDSRKIYTSPFFLGGEDESPSQKESLEAGTKLNSSTTSQPAGLTAANDGTPSSDRGNQDSIQATSKIKKKQTKATPPVEAPAPTNSAVDEKYQPPKQPKLHYQPRTVTFSQTPIYLHKGVYDFTEALIDGIVIQNKQLEDLRERSGIDLTRSNRLKKSGGRKPKNKLYQGGRDVTAWLRESLVGDFQIEEQDGRMPSSREVGERGGYTYLVCYIQQPWAKTKAKLDIPLTNPEITKTALEYSITLEEFFKSLATRAVRIHSDAQAFKAPSGSSTSTKPPIKANPKTTINPPSKETPPPKPVSDPQLLKIFQIHRGPFNFQLSQAYHSQLESTGENTQLNAEVDASANMVNNGMVNCNIELLDYEPPDDLENDRVFAKAMDEIQRGVRRYRYA
ncbi:hypothetical protein ABW19_dt0200077 [Dactylella cylindrospora]|nr:hypothetical protein ABW19_dt0200077 [Dactylella cylindrospora]